ncbi:hypothetical protein CYR75_14420 [Paracoccus jeotgali]|uniref:Glycosyltransferase 2-like domain-containing protein n=1 Tax=Paracoccus jeotgali TaxID=2065379 RepID=A0A2K9MI69_9RHOB|nr:hypothetical protein CYR75_14420 [Paracoccus jeotgali]
MIEPALRASLLSEAALTLQDAGRERSVLALLEQIGPGRHDLPTLRKLQKLRRAPGTAQHSPEWNGRRISAGDRLRCLTLLDPISAANWSSEFQGVPLDRTGWPAQIRAEDHDFILMESTWQGNDGAWIYAMTSPGLKHANARALLEMLEELRESSNKPIVMINKEDPLHFDKFMPIMKFADHIFTTDEDMIDGYRQNTDALSVTAMPFAANMALTNPVNRVREQTEDLCFAGSYYSEGHDERKRQMGYMLEPIVEFKGAIFDRMSVHDNPRYHFPERFRPFVRPAVDFRQMTQLYRRFKVFLNVNTIVTSPTMMSRRVYELLASGTPVVSSPSRAIEAHFDGIVPTASTARQACDAVDRLLNDDRHWWKTSQKGIREVALKHQYANRGNLVRKVVFDQDSAETQPLATIVLSTKRSQFFERIVKNISQQTYPRIEVIFAFHDSWPQERIAELENRLKQVSNIQRVRVLRFPGTVSLGTKLNAAIAEAKGEFIDKFDDDDWYFPNYLQDMILTFDFSGADLAGKWSFPVWLEGSDRLVLRNPGNEHRLGSPYVAGATFVARKSWLQKIPFADRSQGEDTDVLKRTLAAGGKIYSADHFNFIQYRAADVRHHTWRAESDLFERTGRAVGRRDDFQDWVV